MLKIKILCLLLAVLIVLSLHHDVCGQTSKSAATILETLEEYYERGMFAQVIIGLESEALLSLIRTKEDKIHRFALLARANLALDRPHQAQKSVNELLKLELDYNPPYPKDHDFQEMILETKNGIAKKKARKLKCKLVSGGTIVAGALIIILWPPLPPKPLPMPPGPPTLTK